MANTIQNLNEMVRNHNGRLIARNDEDTQAAFRFDSKQIARNVTRRAAEMGATAHQWPTSKTTVSITIR